jgi:hypothetical protein
MMTIGYMQNLLQDITLCGKLRKKDGKFKQQTSYAMAIYNERVALDLYFPEIHWRLDYEDFMAKGYDKTNLIEYRLTDEELERLDTWTNETKMTPLMALNYCAEKNIKARFTFSENQASWCVSLTGGEENKRNSGMTLTSWSDDPFDALFMAVFKASVIFDDGKWVTRKSSQRG